MEFPFLITLIAELDLGLSYNVLFPIPNASFPFNLPFFQLFFPVLIYQKPPSFGHCDYKTQLSSVQFHQGVSKDITMSSI
ncbi:hypothetical protein GCM10022628_22870 [Anoxybacillus suryakundensis]|jgi:hypothetical protein|uniref:Uncharacterized protein n=1 Tax=Parageobacillus genomosp. 1 TaxID=1295642 RepID=A0ABC9VA99_9BACL|nr:hypothetical protein H839_16268 [Parageobacillus genomosp. 1]